MKVTTLKGTLSFFLCLAIPLSAFTGRALAENIIVDAATVWRKNEERRLSVTLNALADNPALRPQDTRPLVDALAEFGARYLAFPGEGSQVYGWATPPFDKANPRLLRYAPGDKSKGNDEWPSNTASLRNEKYDLPKALNVDDFAAICAQTHCRAVINLPYESTLPPLATTFKTAGSERCLPPDCLIPSKHDLFKSSAALVRYFKEKKTPVSFWIFGESLDTIPEDTRPSAKQYATDYALMAKALADVDPDIRLVPAPSARFEKKWWDDFFARLKSMNAEKYLTHVAVRETPFHTSEASWNFDDYSNKSPVLIPQTTAMLESIKNSEVTQDIKVLVTGIEPRTKDLKHTLVAESLGGTLMMVDALGQLNLKPEVELLTLGMTRFAPRGSNSAPSRMLLSTKNELTPLGHAARVWGQYSLDSLIAAGNEPPLENPKVRVFALASNDRKKINLLLVNKKPSKEKTTIALKNVPAKLKARISALHSSRKSSKAADGTPNWSTTVDTNVSNGSLTIELEPVSLTVVELSADQDNKALKPNKP